ncbi:hypothetical protein KKB54_03045 [bacterium]|nr:hypothetical protein [bacterium]MBU1152789.1 hypothetical protein [bacterium]MBU1782303.1 hypothetical protein [bacterium]MBU2599776.1 hypothetical protein [bacterium]
MGKKLIIIVLLLFLNVGLLTGGVYLLDYIGIVKKEVIFSKLPIIGHKLDSTKISWAALEKEELEKIKESLEEKLNALKEEESKVSIKKQAIEKREEELRLWEGRLAEKESSFDQRLSQYEEEEAKLNKLAKYYQNMNPREAALILENLDDLTTINILKRMKDETVAITLMKMNPKKASEISRKMIN